MSIDPRRAQAVFLAAVDHADPADRAFVLDRECSGDGDLRSRVERLLLAHDQPHSLLDQPIVEPGGAGLAPLAVLDSLDSSIDNANVFATGLCGPPRGDPSDITVAAGAPTQAMRRAVPTIDGYEILGELGRGGMGVVYLAREIRLNRPCALKMILAGAHADAQAAVRFLVEAEAVARLQHPNVVQIHHIGETDGLPFFELEYLEGGSLEKRLNGTPWPPRRAAGLTEALAKGVAEAHRLGIVHRDLKPANILLADDGTPKITDFGLAKSLATDSGLTRTDSIMGSPGYMAPEQAEGKAKQVGPPADVYALGAILYELLTGRPPFRGATVLETLEQVKATEPVPPSRLVPGLPRDVETIALRCLQKEPAKRYESAAALADDLRRYLGGEPIVARPVPPWERAIKWARRRPAIAALGAAILLLLASLLGLGIWSYAEIRRSLSVARSEGQRALEQTEIARAQTKVATDRADDLVWQDYINRVSRAYMEVQEDNTAQAEDILHGCPIEKRGWEWHYVKRLCRRERLSADVQCGSVSAVASSPDGRWVATGSGKPLSSGTSDSNIEIWDRRTGRRQPTVHRVQNPVWSLAYSADGSKLAVGGTQPQVEMRDARTGEVLWKVQEPAPPQAMSVAFSPDGRTLAVGFGVYSASQGEIFKVGLYEVESGREIATLPSPKNGANDISFHPDGKRLAVAGFQVVQVWDLPTRSKVQVLPGHTNWVYCLAYSPDGKWLATGSWDRTVKLRDASSGEERLTLFGHEGFVLDLAFSPDGRSLATTSEDRSVRLWEVPSGRQLGVLHGHTDFVQAVAFSPDGREVASGGLEGTLKFWDRQTSLPVVFDRHTGWVVRLAFRRDGRRVISEAGPFRTAGETTLGWDPGTGDLDPALTGVAPEARRDEYLPSSVFPFWVAPPPVTSADGKLVVRAWDGAGGLPTADRSQAYSKSSAMIIDAATSRVRHSLVGHTADLVGIAFSPDGRRVATASLDRTIKLWDTATGREVFTLRGHTAGLLELAFSPDGHRIVSGAIDFTARVWDATPLPADVLAAHEARYQKKLAALKDLTRSTEEAQRAKALAQEGRWDRAAAAFGKLVEREPQNRGLRYASIRSLVRAGDDAGIRRACDRLIEVSDRAASDIQARPIVWSCVLIPDAVSDQEGLVRLAESYNAGRPEAKSIEKSDGLNALGAALCRAGRFEEAIRRIEQSIQARDDGGDPKAFAFLALAHHRLEHPEEAKRWLDKLVAYQPKKGPDFSWDDVDIDILRREAESLILGSRPSAPSSTPDADASAEKSTGHPGAKPE